MLNERNTCVETRKMMHFTQFEQKIIFCDICINFLDYWCIFKEIGHIFSILAYLKLVCAGKQGIGVRIKLNWRNIKLGPLVMNFGMSWLAGVHVVDWPILTKTVLLSLIHHRAPNFVFFIALNNVDKAESSFLAPNDCTAQEKCCKKHESWMKYIFAYWENWHILWYLQHFSRLELIPHRAIFRLFGY